MAVGEEEAAALYSPSSVCFLKGWRRGGDLEPELHNGCLSEFIKQMMFHPLPVGKQGNKWRLMPSVHAFQAGHRK